MQKPGWPLLPSSPLPTAMVTISTKAGETSWIVSLGCISLASFLLVWPVMLLMTQSFLPTLGKENPSQIHCLPPICHPWVLLGGPLVLWGVSASFYLLTQKSQGHSPLSNNLLLTSAHFRQFRSVILTASLQRASFCKLTHCCNLHEHSCGQQVGLRKELAHQRMKTQQYSALNC
uniref:Uncharacterized protein n=1 Tax=Opuntia streptacantha TaxID=393608 RepID=A0A7C9CDC6_OPUST